MIRVRATKDGMYAGYYWLGPIDSDQGHADGEVFDVDERPYEVKDEYGTPVVEMVPSGQRDAQGMVIMTPAYMMENGKLKKDAHGNPIPKIKMASFYSSEWMERVSPDTDLTHEDRVMPFPIPDAYRAKKVKPAKTVVIPQEVAAIAESPI